MRDGLQRRSYLEGLDCLGTVWLVKEGGQCEFRMTGGFVLGAEKASFLPPLLDVIYSMVMKWRSEAERSR